MAQPNVIVITTDQQRYDSVGHNGSAFMSTPNMDRLGREGVSFSRAYCPNTVCTPSRVSLMTGLHLSRHGAYNIGTYAGPDGYSAFLSTRLRESGYRTHHIGKAHWHPWGVPNPETAPVDDKGTPFRDFAGFETAELSTGHALWGITMHYAQWVRSKGYDPAQFKLERLFPGGDFNETGDWELPVGLHSGTWLAERAIDFLEQHDRSQPFYLNLGFQDPHHPHVLPFDYERRVDPEDIPYPDVSLDGEDRLAEHVPHFHSGTLMDTRFVGRFEVGGNGKYAWRPYFANEAMGRATRAYYYSMVQLIDDQLGRILKALDQLGYRDNTIVIFASDHGEMLGDHSIGQKGPLVYEGVTHIPLLIRYPNGFAPIEVDDCVSLVDLMPTILDFAGLADPVRRDGRSLKARLQGNREALADRGGVRIEYKEEADRIRFKCWVTPEWKLGVYPGESFGELYDLKNDPGEKRNLYEDPAYSGVKNSLMLELLRDMERSEPLSERPCRV